MSVPSDGDWLSTAPLAEHTPLTPAEAGLVLDPPRRRRWPLALALLAVLVLVAGVVAVLTREAAPSSVLDLSAGACFTPVVQDVADAVDRVDCGPGTPQVVQKVRSPAGLDAPYPGAGALTILGEGACQGQVDSGALVVAVPSSAAWVSGDRIVVCTRAP